MDTAGDPIRLRGVWVALRGMFGGGGVPAYCARRARRSGVPKDGVYDDGIASLSLTLADLIVTGSEGEDMTRQQ